MRSPLIDLPAVDRRLTGPAAEQPLARAVELRAVLQESVARLKPDGLFGTTEEWRHVQRAATSLRGGPAAVRSAIPRRGSGPGRAAGARLVPAARSEADAAAMAARGRPAGGPTAVG